MRSKRVDGGFGGLVALGLICCAGSAAAAQPPAEPGAEGLTNRAAPLTVRLDQAVLMALTQNRALRVERFNPEIRQTQEEVERAAFDPVLAAEAAFERSYAATNRASADAAERTRGGVELARRLPTGTTLGAALTTDREEFRNTPVYATGAGISLTQALLQGRPVAVNLVGLRQARLDTDISAYELRGFAETLVAAVEIAYWECVLAQRRIEILEKSLALAEQQLREIEQRIRVGGLPETEVAAAQAEVALRREARINARSSLATARLRLLRLMAPGALLGPRAELTLLTEPVVPAAGPEAIEAHVAVALQRRPDLNQARLALERGDLELVRTRNGLLPRLDLFIELGDTGYAASFGDSVDAIDGQDLGVAGGLVLAFPIHNRQARAVHRRARYSREQLEESLRNLEDLVRVDVESAHIEVERTREQIAATATTREFQEEKVRVETVKFGVGRSTALLVAQTQRDLVSSQVAEVDAVVRHLESQVNLYRQEGSLLERRGVAAPGRQPTTEP